MKSMLKKLSAVALTGVMVLPVLADDTSSSSTADAKDQKDLKKVIEDQGINYVETAQKGITLSGYVEASYTEQFAGSGEYGGGIFGATSANPNVHSNLREFDVNNNNFNLNAVKIALEKALPDKNDWAAGFRIDTIYGQDAAVLNGGAGSVEDGGASSFFLEQALVKFRVPVGNGLDIYIGKFVTFLGYEVIESPANLNFSRGLLFTNAIPLTHTGIYADYKFNDMIEAKFGIVDAPWNSSESQSSDDVSDKGGFGKALTGQVNVTAPGKNANICQSFIYSPEGDNGTGYVGSFGSPGSAGTFDNGPYVVYDIWGNWNPTFVKDSALTLGFNFDIGYNGASGLPATVVGGGGGGPTFATGGLSDSNTWYGLALYASYKFNKWLTLSGRGEYLHEDEAFSEKFATQTDPATGQGEPADDFSFTLTASFTVWDNLLTRVEYRYDHLHPDLSGSAAGGGEDQSEISLDAVYSF
jgi:hypothetical protein